jgi:GNAT superfamily N-acetyltransferase
MAYIVVAENAGEITAAAARIDDLVALLWVHPAHQRKGMGSALLDAIETDMRNQGTIWQSWNVSAIMTKPLGFTEPKAGSPCVKRWTKWQEPQKW